MNQTTTFGTLKDFAIRRYSDRKDAKAIAQIQEAVKDALDSLSKAKEWSHLIERTRVTTADEYTTGTYAINKGATSLIGTGTGLAAAGITNLYTVKLAGESVDYDVSSIVSTNVAHLKHAYVGESNLSGTTARFFKRSYDLPENFLKMLKIVDARRPGSKLTRLSYDEMLEMHQRRSSGGTPTHYSIENKTGGARRQLWLYPYPSGTTRFQYDITYKRRPAVPSADADIIDWPDDQMPLLRAAIELELSLKSEDFNVSGMAEQNFARKLADGSKSDFDEVDSFFIGGAGPSTRSPIDPTNLDAVEGG